MLVSIHIQTMKDIYLMVALRSWRFLNLDAMNVRTYANEINHVSSSRGSKNVR